MPKHHSNYSIKLNYLAQNMQRTLYVFKDEGFKMNLSNKITRQISILGMALIVSGCQSNFLRSSEEDTAKTSLNVLSNRNGEDAAHLAAINEVLDASVDNVPTINAVGYAVVSSQPGRSANQKRLMAIRSARMAAMRDLAEQIHGLKVEGNTTVIDLMVQNDTFRGIVSGTIRGARTVRINPTGTDTYEVLLEIDKDTLSYLLRQARTVA